MRARSFYDRTIAPPLRLILALLVFSVIGAIGFGGYWLAATPITVTLNGHPITVRTHQTTVDGLLREVGAGLTSADSITPARATVLHSGLNVTIQTAASVVVDADHQPRQFLTRATDPQAILSAAGVTLSAHDQLVSIGSADLSVIRDRKSVV